MMIRLATPTDREAWLPLWAGYNAFYGYLQDLYTAYDRLAERSGFIVYRKQLG
jgi:hypothetical protein